jgi:hypothetical protein
MLRRALMITSVLMSLLFASRRDVRAQVVRPFQPDSIPAGFESAYLVANFGAYVPEWSLGDFNGDGIPDLVGNSNSDLLLQIGVGDGTFLPPVTALSAAGYLAAIGDFNGDGHLDVLMNSGSLTVYLGDGAGNFAAATSSVYLSNIGSIAVGDFNGDGALDVLVTSAYVSPGSISVFLGNGDGSFQPPLTQTAGDSVGTPLVGDFDRDGKPDLVLPDSYSNTVEILIGNGDGTFRRAPDVFIGADPTSLVAADFNGDGQLDLAAIVNGGSDPSWSISILLGYGDGLFQAVRAVAPIVSNAVRIAVGDIDGDGSVDLGIAGYDYYSGYGNFPSKFLVLRGAGDGTFSPGASFILGPGVGSVLLSDLNGDGNLDVVAGSSNGETWAMLGRQNGSFRAVKDVRTANPTIGDFDGDGILDLVSVETSGAGVELVVRHGNGDGTFAVVRRLNVSLPSNIAGAADFDGDGNLDLLLVQTDSLFQETTAVPYFGAGDGTFRAGATIVVAGNVYPAVFVAPLADFNGDGIMDFVMFNTSGWGGPTELDAYLGRGDGTFDLVSSSFPFTPTSAAVADFDGDGLPDLAIGGTTNYLSMIFTMVRNLGNGSFGSPSYLTMPGVISGVAAGDLDGDGRPDLLVADGSDSLISLLRGHGDLTFDAAVTFGLDGTPSAVAIADFNRDGNADFVVTTNGGSQALVAYGTGNGGFQSPYAYFVGGAPLEVKVASFRPGYLPDVMTINYDGTTSIIQSEGLRQQDVPSHLFTIKPCRLVDTRRSPASPTGLSANTTRFLAVTGGGCGIPPDASAIVANVTAVRPSDNGDFRLFPAGTTLPSSSTLNFAAGRSRANNAIVPLGGIDEKGIGVRCDMPAGTADLILDVSGYFR